MHPGTTPTATPSPGPHTLICCRIRNPIRRRAARVRIERLLGVGCPRISQVAAARAAPSGRAPLRPATVTSLAHRPQRSRQPPGSRRSGRPLWLPRRRTGRRSPARGRRGRAGAALPGAALRPHQLPPARGPPGTLYHKTFRRVCQATLVSVHCSVWLYQRRTTCSSPSVIYTWFRSPENYYPALHI